MSATLVQFPRPTGAVQFTRPVTVSSQPLLHIAQDAEIYALGEEANCFYKLISGVVRLCSYSADGRRHIDSFIRPGEVFGYELGDEYSLSAEAVTACTLQLFRRRNMEEQGLADGVVAAKLCTHVMHSLARSRAHSQLLGRCNAQQRLAGFLLELSADSHDQVVSLPMNRQDIADYLGLTIETVSRTLAQMEKDQMISLFSARQIKLHNRAAMAEFCW